MTDLWRKAAAWLAAAGIALLAAGCQPEAAPASDGAGPESTGNTTGTVSVPETERISQLEPQGYEITHPDAPTRIYAYRDRSGKMTVEEIADILVGQYIGDMRIKQDNKSFEILETHNLRYTLEDAQTYTEQQYDEETGEYATVRPLKENQYACEVSYQFRFDGAVYHEEPGDGWYPCYYLTFVIQRDGDLYRMAKKGTTFPDAAQAEEQRRPAVAGEYAVTTPICPNRTYTYRDLGGDMTIEEIADILAGQYIGDMMIEQDDKSFVITEYCALHVDVTDAETYNGQRTDGETGAWNAPGRPLQENQWHCFIGYQYLYEGHVDAEGNDGVPTGDWCPGGWHLGYIIERDGGLYTMTRNEG